MASVAAGFVQEAVRKRQAANGLAIIVANEHSCNPVHKHLPGARQDLFMMKEAFEKLKFATVPILNASKDEIVQAIQAAASPHMQYPKAPNPDAYRRIVFYFSGHGDGSNIYAHDGKVDIHTEVFYPLQPGCSPHLAGVATLFFIDACRGEDTQPFVSLPGGVRARGGGIDRMPSICNYLVACSTLPQMKAYENQYGGFWTQELAWQLSSDDNVDRTLNSILTKVNRKVIEVMSKHCENLQQPVLESALLDDIYLLKEAYDIGSIPDMELYFTENEFDGSGCHVIKADPEFMLEQQNHEDPYQPQGASASRPPDYTNTSQSSYEPNTPLQPQQIDVHSIADDERAFLKGLTMHGQVPSMHMQQPLAHYIQNEASGSAYPPVTLSATAGTHTHNVPHQAGVPVNTSHHNGIVPPTQRYNSEPYGQAGQPASGYERHQSEPSIQPQRNHSTAPLIPNRSEGGPEPQPDLGHYRSLLNHFSQKRTIFDYHDHGVTEKYENNQTLYQAYLSCKHVATGREIVGTSKFLPVKSKAREEAARDAYMQLDPLIQQTLPFSQEGRGTTKENSNTISGKPSSASPSSTSSKSGAKWSETPTTKVWKSRLKEYFDKKTKGEPAVITYKTKESTKGGRFSATVCCPEIGYAEGEKDCPSKSAAGHSAAYHALKKLNALE